MTEQYSPEKGEKKNRPKAIIAQIAVFLGLVCLTAIALRPLQLSLINGMSHVRDRVIGAAEDFIGREIRYSSIRPSFFGYFDIRNIRIIANEPDDEYLMSIPRLRVSFSLRDLLRGRVTAIRAIELDRPIVKLDSQRDRDILQLFSLAQANGDRDIAGFLPLSMDLQIRNGSFSFNSPVVLYHFYNIALDINFYKGQIALDGNCRTAISFTEFLGGHFNLNTDLSLNGEFLSPLGKGSAFIGISHLYGRDHRQSPVFRTVPADFGLFFDGQNLSLRNLNENAPFNFNIDYDTATESLSAGFHSNSFNLADFVTFFGGLQGGNQWLNQQISGTADFERNNGELRYSVSLGGGQGPLDSQGIFTDAFVIHLTGNEELAVVEDFFVSSAPINLQEMAGSQGARFFQGMFSFNGNVGISPIAPAGVISFDNFSLTGTDNICARLDVETTGQGINISSGPFAVGETELDKFYVNLTPSENGAVITLAASHLQNETIGLQAVVSLQPLLIDACLALNSFSAAALAGISRPFVKTGDTPAAVQGFLENTLISTEVSIATDFRSITYNTPGLTVSQRGNESAAKGFFAFSGTQQHFSLNEGIFTRGGQTMSVTAYANHSNLSDIDFLVTANYEEYSWFLSGRFLDRSFININGSYGLNISVNTADGAFYGRFEAQNFPLPMQNKPAYLSFNASFQYDSAELWFLDLDYLDAAWFSGPANGPNAGPGSIRDLRISGMVDQGGAVFPVVHYSDNIGPLFGHAEFSWPDGFSKLHGTAIITDGPGFGEYYRFDGFWTEGQFNLLISANRMRVDRLLGNNGNVGNVGIASITSNVGNIHNALASGEIRVILDTHLPRPYRVEISLNSLTATVMQNEFRASAFAELDGDKLAVRGLEIEFAGINAQMSALNLTRHGSLSAVNTSIHGNAGEMEMLGTFSLNASFQPVASWLNINQAFNVMEGYAHFENFRYAHAVSGEPFRFIFSRNNGDFSVFGGPRNMLRLQGDKEGNFFAALSSPSPVRGSVTGSIRDGYIDAACSNIFVDLGELWALIPPINNFALGGGFVNANFDIRGPLANPEFFGTARATSLRIQVPNFIPEDIRPVPAVLTLEGNMISYGPVQAAVGNGAGISSGRFLFDGWIPSFFSIDVDVPRETPIPFTFEIANFNTTGDAAGHLNVSMDNMNFEITGNLHGNNTQMLLGSYDFDFFQQAGEREEPFQNSRHSVLVNFTITSGPAVEFFWPDLRFPLFRANPAMGTVINITSDSASRQFSVDSDIRIRSGELFYFDRSFYIRSGQLVLRENEQHFNPRLSARAEIRDRTNDGPVTIAMIVENEPLLSFVPRFESTPMLTQVEIFEILGQNVFVGDQGDAMQRFLVASTADILGQFIFVRQVERQVRNLLNLDMFSIRTQFLPNAALDMVNRRGGVRNYFDNTTVFGGRYIGGDIFIQGMLSMRYDEHQGGVRFEPDIGIDLQNPLFNIRWSFVPTNPETRWITDNSITFTWNWTF